MQFLVVRDVSRTLSSRRLVSGQARAPRRRETSNLRRGIMVGKPFWEYRCGSCTAARQASRVLFAGGNPSPKSAGTDALLAVDFILARVLFLAVPAAPYRFRCRRAAVSIASTEHLHEFAARAGIKADTYRFDARTTSLPRSFYSTRIGFSRFRSWAPELRHLRPAPIAGAERTQDPRDGFPMRSSGHSDERELANEIRIDQRLRNELGAALREFRNDGDAAARGDHR